MLTCIDSNMFKKKNRRRPEPTDWLGLTIKLSEDILALVAITFVMVFIFYIAFTLANVEVSVVEECRHGPAWDYTTESCKKVIHRKWVTPW